MNRIIIIVVLIGFFYFNLTLTISSISKSLTKEVVLNYNDITEEEDETEKNAKDGFDEFIETVNYPHFKYISLNSFIKKQYFSYKLQYNPAKVTPPPEFNLNKG